jgi:hypothetical protein
MSFRSASASFAGLLTEVPERSHVGEDGLDLLSNDSLGDLVNGVADLGVRFGRGKSIMLD